MAVVSVAEAARRLGVGTVRVHQRIADGSLRAERIGSQWAIDERSLPQGAECKPGRPLSRRSAWAQIALAAGEVRALSHLAPVERSRARDRLDRLYRTALKPLRSEDDLSQIGAVLRALLRNRAERRQYQAASADLADLRADPRLALSGLSVTSGIAPGTIVEGYIRAGDLGAFTRAYLLVPADSEPNVVLHVLEGDLPDNASSPLLLAADLAEYRRPREERRAAELLRDAALQGKASQ
jgi:excisionase family DNA binding protein